MLPPPRHQHKVDPETLIEQIEDDPISQFVWTIVPKTVQALRKLSALLRWRFGSEKQPCDPPKEKRAVGS